VIGAFLFGLAALAGIFLLVQKRRRAAQQQEGIRYIYRVIQTYHILQLKYYIPCPVIFFSPLNQTELYNMVGRPNVFSNAELKLATDNFSPQNILGEGGYGTVYKV
jgi:uncharacterized protein YfkK (UPF0435 family)